MPVQQQQQKNAEKKIAQVEGEPRGTQASAIYYPNFGFWYFSKYHGHGSQKKNHTQPKGVLPGPPPSKNSGPSPSMYSCFATNPKRFK